MTDLSKIARKDTFDDSDNVLVYSNSLNDARLIPKSVITASLTSTSSKGLTQYASPSSTAFTVLINDSYQDVWLILQPTGTLAAGTIKLPSSSQVIDNQTVTIFSTNEVTTLTIDLNGSSGTGMPTTIAANGFFTLRYNSTLKTWYKVA